MSSSDPDLEAYRLAIKAMQSLPAENPKNWIAQANIHANHCPHHNWFFLPWHRAYLVAFERICRDMSGKQDFALPYWDWTVDRQLPPAFTAGTPQNNILNHDRPGFRPTDSLPDDMVGPEVIERILKSPDFESLGSSRPDGQDSVDPFWQRRPGEETELEFNPHDGVHGSLRGDMGRVPLSPRDPIFWLHHCNLDRIWSIWNKRNNANTTDKLWTDFRFDDQFVNADGSPGKVDVTDLLSVPTLGYRYDSEVAGALVNTRLADRLAAFRNASDVSLERATMSTVQVDAPSGAPIEVAATLNKKAASRLQPLSVPVKIGGQALDAVRASSLPPSGSREAGPPPSARRIIATISGLEAPKDLSTRVRLFVNCDYLSPATPLTDPHFVTSFSFFGSAGDHGDHGGGSKTISVDLTAALGRAARAGSVENGEVVVQLLSAAPGSEPSATVVRPKKVQIAIV